MSHSKSQASKSFIYILPIILLLSGCIGLNNWVWQHPKGYDDQVLQQDTAVCETIAAQELNRYDYYYPYPSSIYGRYYYRYDRHYYPSHYYRHYHYNTYREFQDRRRFFRICMKSKGWKQVKSNNPPKQSQ